MMLKRNSSNLSVGRSESPGPDTHYNTQKNFPYNKDMSSSKHNFMHTINEEMGAGGMHKTYSHHDDMN